MIDFEALINAALKEGTSAEDLASKFTEALNKSKKVEAAKPTRESTIACIQDIFDRHIESDNLDLADAAALIWLCAVEDTEEGKKMTSPDELMEFLEFITNDVTHSIEKWKARKLMSDIFSFCGPFGKLKETKEKSDEEKIQSFLRDLFK